jgi:hypothetical protein
MIPLLHRRALVLVSALAILVTPHAGRADEAATLLAVIQDFYKWTAQNADSLKALEPKIDEVPGSKRLTLDAAKADAYAAYLITSGFFHPQYFPRNVKRYYTRVHDDLKAISDADYADMKRDGRGPLMETEDMDPFFCAQEYEYDPSFIDGMTITSASVNGDHAQAVVKSPYEWETTFTFLRRSQRWLITGFCAFQQQSD